MKRFVEGVDRSQSTLFAIKSPNGYSDTQNRDLSGECRVRPWLLVSTQLTAEYRSIFLN